MSNSFKQKERAVLTGFWIGIIGLVLRVIAFVLSNSLTVLTGILLKSSGTAANLLSYQALRKVAKGRTFTYNYGYGKLENLASLVVASVMFVSVGVIVYGVISRLFFSTAKLYAAGIIFALIVSGIDTVLNGWLWRKNFHIAKLEHSPIMESQWRQFRARFAANICATTSFALTLIFWEKSWVFIFDPVFSLILAIFLFNAAYSVFTNSVYDLLDRTLDESLQIIVLRELAVYYNDYTQLHGITSRRSGGKVYIELFLEFDKEQKMMLVQEIINKIRASLEKKIKNSQVIVAPVTSQVK